jgi:hypothetical protein
MRGYADGATRQALMLLRRRRRALASDLAARSLLDGTFEDAELEALKRRWAAEFKEAFAEAVASLTSKQRNVLRYHAIDQLTIDQIGSLHGVHRVTAFRWVEQARAAILVATRAALKARLDLSESEPGSVLGAIASRSRRASSVSCGDAAGRRASPLDDDLQPEPRISLRRDLPPGPTSGVRMSPSYSSSSGHARHTSGGFRPVPRYQRANSRQRSHVLRRSGGAASSAARQACAKVPTQNAASAATASEWPKPGKAATRSSSRIAAKKPARGGLSP